MESDSLGNWVENARKAGSAAQPPQGVRVIRATPQSRGHLIMEIAEKLRPWLTKMFDGTRDENGMLVQPARVRGIALNMAQRIVTEEEKKQATA